jgi:hypothetical protein
VHAVATLFGVFGAQPRHSLAFATALARNRSRWLPWITDWATPQWDHKVSGIVAGLSMTGALPADFKAFYFGFLTAHADPDSGYFRCSTAWPELCASQHNKTHTSSVVLVHDMTNYEHVLWEYVWEGVPWPFPTKVVDRGLAMQNASTGFFGINSDGSFGDPAAASINCHQFDGLHTVTRSSLLAGRYRWAEVRTMCERFLRAAERFLCDETRLFRTYTDSDGLNGGLQAVAECAQHFPELVRTDRPWRTTLDHAPFM